MDYNEQSILSVAQKGMPHKEEEHMAPLTLAYLGDTVYDLFIRSRLIARHNLNVHGLHERASRFVRASAQARVAAALYADLTPMEQSVLRRGRNAKVSTVPKNADIGEYHMATGLEAVLGYLYLSKQKERLGTLLDAAWNIMEKDADTHGES